MLPRTSCVSSWPTSLRGTARRRFPSVWQRSPRWTPRARSGRRWSSMEQGDADGAVLGINGQTGGSLMFSAKTNTVEIWTLTNTTNYDHPFHLHGFFFQVLDIDGAEPPVRAWRDTVSLWLESLGSPSRSTTAPACGCSTVTSSTTRIPGDDGDAPPDAVNGPSDEVRGLVGRQTHASSSESSASRCLCRPCRARSPRGGCGSACC